MSSVILKGFKTAFSGMHPGPDQTTKKQSQKVTADKRKPAPDPGGLLTVFTFYDCILQSIKRCTVLLSVSYNKNVSGLLHFLK